MLKVITTALVLAGALSAQNVYVPDNNAAAGTCNIIPFGNQSTSATWLNQKYQTMITTTDIGAGVQVANICDLGFAPCIAALRHFDTIEIVLGQTKATSLSTTFSANLVTNVKTVLKAKNYDWHNDLPNVWTRIGTDTDYLYLQANGNLVIQITVTGAQSFSSSTAFPGMRRGTRQRIFRTAYSGQTTGVSGAGASKTELVIQREALNDFGKGCKGTNGTPDLHLSGSAKIGTGTVGISVTNCPTNNALLHVFSLQRFEPAINLNFAGAPNCFLYIRPDIILGGATSSSGTYRLAAKLPNDKNLICVRVYTQAFPSDPKANSWGRTSSNYGRILPGG